MTTILLLGGPAGVGKSTFASTFLNTQGWGHIEFDGYSGGGVDASLRPSWNAYYDHSRPVQLWKELCRQHSASENVVVTVPGTCRWNSGVREVEFRCQSIFSRVEFRCQWNSGVTVEFRCHSGIPVSEHLFAEFRCQKEFRCQSIF